MAHHRSAPPTKPPTAQPRHILKPSEMQLDQLVLRRAAHERVLGSASEVFLEIAPSRLGEGAHPTTRMAVNSLEWHARELELQMDAAKESDMMLTVIEAINVLEAAAAVLKCLQPAKDR